MLAACWAQEGEWSEDAEDLGKFSVYFFINFICTGLLTLCNKRRFVTNQLISRLRKDRVIGRSPPCLHDVSWGEKFTVVLNDVDFPQELSSYCDRLCVNEDHRRVINELYSSCLCTQRGCSV